MTLEVIDKTLADIFALCDDTDMRRRVLANLIVQDGIVRAPEDDGVNLAISGQEIIDVALYKVVGAITLTFASFYQRYPDRACLTADSDVGKEFLDL